MHEFEPFAWYPPHYCRNNVPQCWMRKINIFMKKVKCCLDAMKSRLILDIGVDWISRGCSMQRTSLLSAPLMSKYACIILKLLNTYTTKLGLTKVPPHCIATTFRKSPVLEYWPCTIVKIMIKTPRVFVRTQSSVPRLPRFEPVTVDNTILILLSWWWWWWCRQK